MDDARREDDLADLLMRRLSELGLSQSALAREAGISADTVRKLLRGEGQSFRSLTLASLSRALGWPTDALERMMDGEADPWAVDPDAAPTAPTASTGDTGARTPSGDGVTDPDLARRVERLERILGDAVPPGTDAVDDLRRRVARLEDLALDQLARS